MPSTRVSRALLAATMLLACIGLFVALLGNLATASAGRDNCRRIDALYTRVRENSQRSFQELRQNAELLGIKVTPELVAKARADRDRRLREYAPIECSFLPWK